MILMHSDQKDAEPNPEGFGGVVVISRRARVLWVGAIKLKWTSIYGIIFIKTMISRVSQ